MKVDVLVSTMNRTEPSELLSKMNLLTDQAIIINQVTKEDVLPITTERFYSFRERGLSKSRNHALQLTTADVIVIADDDETFKTNSLAEIAYYHEKYQEYDLIMFHVDKVKPVQWAQPTELSYIQSMRISSVQMTMKTQSVRAKNLAFDETFGMGAYYHSGEENIFLFDALKKGCKILYVPVTIAECDDSESGWDRRNTPENCRKRGAIFYRMSKKFYPILIIQFAIRKRQLCTPYVTVLENIKYMFEGVKTYRNE